MSPTLLLVCTQTSKEEIHIVKVKKASCIHIDNATTTFYFRIIKYSTLLSAVEIENNCKLCTYMQVQRQFDWFLTNKFKWNTAVLFTILRRSASAVAKVTTSVRSASKPVWKVMCDHSVAAMLQFSLIHPLLNWLSPQFWTKRQIFRCIGIFFVY